MIKIAIENPTDTDLRKLKMIIYSITNKINGKRYIGKAEDGFIQRYSGCKWWKKPSNDYIFNSVQKYGLENYDIFCAMLNGRFKQHKGWQLEATKIRKRKVISPDGEVFTIKDRDLRKFCRERGNINRHGLNDILLGHKKSYKGWTIP